jgi:FkbM family methyltransferase
MLGACLVRFVGETLSQAIEGSVPGPVRRIVDVGASIGHYTLLFRAIWPEAEIWAIEPSSTNFRYLMANTGHIPGVLHLPIAAGEALYRHSIAMPSVKQKPYQNNPEGNSGIISMFGDSNLFREDVPVVPLDNIIDACDFIKIDTEGYETKVIQGAARLLRESRPALHIEFIRENLELAGTTRAELNRLIASFDYLPVRVLRHDVMFLPKEKCDALRR